MFHFRMAITSAEIQKAYKGETKTKKQEGSEFLQKEKIRQRQYYVPAAELSKFICVNESFAKLRWNRLTI